MINQNCMESGEAMMKVWGMISVEDEKAGFDVVLDEDWYVVLIEKGETRARFDPRDYTATELLMELEDILAKIRGESKIAC
ncbi:MAG: hypothetical protein HQ553_00955 [Chloroflexi bacterium]|nr:hypothetical protein [Chloroflexota bacterium]